MYEDWFTDEPWGPFTFNLKTDVAITQVGSEVIASGDIAEKRVPPFIILEIFDWWENNPYAVYTGVGSCPLLFWLKDYEIKFKAPDRIGRHLIAVRALVLGFIPIGVSNAVELLIE